MKCCAVSATEHCIPPLMIFKRKRLKPELTDNAPVGPFKIVWRMFG